MLSVAQIQGKGILFQLRSFDRIYLNLYNSIFCTFGGIAYIIKSILGWSVPLPAAFKSVRDQLVSAIEEYASSKGISIYKYEKGDNKEQIAREHLQALDSSFFGVFFIGKVQEKVRVPQVFNPRNPNDPSKTIISLRWGNVMANQYYFYFRQKDWGMGFLKFSSYAPFGGKVCINGHEWLKAQLDQKGISYEAMDNGIGNCEDPKAVQRIADSLKAKHLLSLVHWLLKEIPHPLKFFPEVEGRAPLSYKISICQIEIALTQVLKKASEGLQFFEQVIKENLDLGRPDRVSAIFGKRITKRCPQKRFQTNVFTYGVIPVLHIYYLSNKLKQYFKEVVGCKNRGLRHELTVNNPREFGIGKTLNEENFAALRELGKSTIQRLLDIETLSHDPGISVEKIAELEEPAEIEGRRVSPLPRSNKKVRMLLNALISCHLIYGGFRNRDLRAKVAQLEGVDASNISSGSMSYNLRRLKGHGLIEKVEGTHRYEVTKDGLALAIFISRLENRVYRDGLSDVFLEMREEEKKPLKEAIENIDVCIEKICEKHRLDLAA